MAENNSRTFSFFVNQSDQTNFTVSSRNDGWLDVFVAVTSALGYIFNLVPAIALMLTSEIRTPFSICLIPLTFVNALYCLCAFLRSHCFLNSSSLCLSKMACAIQAYSIWTLSSMSTNLHVLLTMNRIWAMFFPVSYRQNYNKRTSLSSMVVIAVYVHTVSIPGVVLKGLQCDTDDPSWMLWENIAMIVLFDVQVLFIALSLPFMFVKFFILKPIGTRHTKGTAVLFALALSVTVCWLPYNLFDTIFLFADVEESGSIQIVESVVVALYVMQVVLDPLIMIATMTDLRMAIKKGIMRKLMKITPLDTPPVRSLQSTSGE